ncbi:unnamed protein product [Periconia digitata]|uniref:Mannose-1-phosphate guanylyltransferase n=1 Tax=Periconia digitata TaxID=1303443 RepID=A0A9W4UW73_9PLEO|nr:unnamed protein product [Periconia digitata]
MRYSPHTLLSVEQQPPEIQIHVVGEKGPISSSLPASSKSVVAKGLYDKSHDRVSYLSAPASDAKKRKEGGTEEAEAEVLASGIVGKHSQQQNNPVQSLKDLLGERELRTAQVLTSPDAGYRFDQSTSTPARPQEVEKRPSPSLPLAASFSDFTAKPFPEGKQHQSNNNPNTSYSDRGVAPDSNQISQKTSKSCSNPPTTTYRVVQTLELSQQQTAPSAEHQDPYKQMAADIHQLWQRNGQEAQPTYLNPTEKLHRTATPTSGSDFTVNSVAVKRTPDHCDILYILNPEPSPSRSQIEADSITKVTPPYHQAAKQRQRHQNTPLTTPNTAQVLPLARAVIAPSIQKTEKQKMLNKSPFMPFCSQLIDERMQCAQAMGGLDNAIDATNGITKSGGYVGSGLYVATPFYCKYGYNLSFGDNTVIGPDCRLLDSGKITIGRNAEIGAGVTVSTLKMPAHTNTLKRVSGIKVAQEICIGDNAYVGSGCIIEAGVRIGHSAIVRPQSVVVHDIPAGCIASGNPAGICTVDWVN